MLLCYYRQCAVSHVVNLSGTNVLYICDSTDKRSLDMVTLLKSIQFLNCAWLQC